MPCEPLSNIGLLTKEQFESALAGLSKTGSTQHPNRIEPRTPLQGCALACPIVRGEGVLPGKAELFDVSTRGVGLTSTRVMAVDTPLLLGLAGAGGAVVWMLSCVMNRNYLRDSEFAYGLRFWEPLEPAIASGALRGEEAAIAKLFELAGRRKSEA